MKYELLLSVGVFMASTFLAGVVRNRSGRWRLIDVPNERSSHSTPTPRGGGLSIVITFLSGLVVMAVGGIIPLDLFVGMAGGGAMVALIGFLDDHYNIHPQWRLMVHFIAAGWVLYWLGGMTSINLGVVVITSKYFCNLIALIALVWLINLYNFMDGIDCIAGAEAIFIAVAVAVLFILQGGPMVFFWVVCFLAAAVGGFLLWNIPPAKLFMGDVGSSFIGVILGTLIISSVETNSIPLPAWFILMAVFLVDSLVTLLKRIHRGDRWYESHCSHAYQHAARRYKSHGYVVLVMMAINLFWLFPLALAACFWREGGELFMIAAFIPVAVLAVRLKAGEKVENSFSCELTS